jgi:hypothetical protein
LATLASRGGGPRFVKFGRKPLYDEDELLAWAEGRLSQPVSSTSELWNPQPAKRSSQNRMVVSEPADGDGENPGSVGQPTPCGPGAEH